MEQLKYASSRFPQVVLSTGSKAPCFEEAEGSVEDLMWLIVYVVDFTASITSIKFQRIEVDLARGV
jgi:hypothetical protein